jgi:superfamily II DNA or RNA helicase
MMLELREAQLRAIQMLRDGFAAGHRSQILVGPTGFGKTECAIALLEATKKKGNKAAMILDRIVLCDQTSQRLEKYKIDHGVLQSGHWRYRPYENIQVCSAQTLEKRGSFPGLSLLVIDECFPAGTNVSTPSGPKDISVVRCGDTVYNATGVGKVISVMVKPAVELVKLEFEDGTTIECTDGHPIFTNRGWVKAAEMEVGSISYSIEGLHLLWDSISSKNQDRQREGGGLAGIWGLAETASLLKVLLEEAEESNEQPCFTHEDEGNLARDKTSPDSKGGEWMLASVAAACLATRFGGGMASRVCGSNKNEASEDWLSNLLQSGHCERGDDGWDRVGRWLSLLSGEESTRFQEDRISCFPRLVNISRIQREGITPVFNLHVSGHPSYFANGRLVHNCHAKRKQTTDFIKNNPHIKVVGLSATPLTKGLGDIYTNIVNPVTTKELVDDELLVPLRVFVAKEIDMTGAKKIAGEWSEAEATKRGMQITGDIVSEWIKKTHEIYGKPVKTIVFCSGVAHGEDLSRKFAEQGYNFISISYKDDGDFKREVIEDFGKPDTDIHGLIATDVLTKGFSVDDVMIGVSARPFSKSLSSHIQQMGRVMRTHPSKSFATWLCHSGNYLRFQEDWEEIYNNGVHELDDAREKAKKEKTDKEKEAAKCPKCGHLWAGGSDTCIHCGYTREKRSMVESVPGEMEELKAAASRESKQDWYSMCQYMVKNHGWSTGRAAHTYKDKFGVWPKGLAEAPKTPSVEFDKAVKAALIRYLKGKAKK